MQTPLRSRVQLELLARMRAGKSPLQKGFTLVELMIVVAIVGILSAVALPQFLQARNSAAAGSRVGEMLGLAKECATLAASDVGAAPTVGSGSAVSVSCGSSGGTVATTWTSGPAGIRCLTATTVESNGGATVTIDASGGMSCAFS